MRRSSSSPSLHNISLAQQQPNMKSSRSFTNLQALPTYIEPPPLIVETWKHVQAHSMLRAPAHVVDMCMMDVYGKPVDLTAVINTPKNEKVQRLAFCIATPPEVETVETHECEPIVARLRSSRRGEYSESS